LPGRLSQEIALQLPAIDSSSSPSAADNRLYRSQIGNTNADFSNIEEASEKRGLLQQRVDKSGKQYVN